MSEANAVVAAFMEAFNAMDVDAIVGAFTDDAVYHNMPGPPVSGRSVIEAVIRGYLGLASEMDWQVAYQAEVAPGVVLNVKPVADVAAITVHGDHATIEDPR